MNKQGFIRTLEAVIAVVIVLGIMLSLAPAKQPETDTPANLKQAQAFILNHIVTNENFRNCIMTVTAYGECSASCTIVDSFVNTNAPKGYAYRCEICGSASTCSSPLPLDKSLYTDSRFIATDPAKVIRLVFWER